jgi:uncharacterized membrane protein YbhN (UPF0104 family)
VFAALFAKRGPDAPEWMMPTAYAALGVFAAAMVFLGFARRWPEGTVAFAVSASQLRRISPRLADKVSEKLHAMISGLVVLKDPRNLLVFVLWSLIYWLANGLAVWVLARGFGLDLSLLAAYATMGLVAVGITLPNSPGLVGQFQYFTLLGLSLYLPDSVIKTDGLAFAIALHGIQVVWYVGIGALAMASRHVSFAELVASRSVADDPDHASG